METDLPTASTDCGPELVLALTRRDLVILNNALAYLCDGIDLGPEFGTLIGGDRAAASRLLAKIQATLDQRAPS